jgi:hypothetical protein
MALADTVRAGVALANSLTGSLQVTVQHEAWTHSDKQGAPKFDAPIAQPALVEYKHQLYRMPGGQEVTQRARVTFVGPIAGNGAEGRREPIDPRDRITLPDGTTGPILDVQGLADPATAGAYLYVVALA